MTYCCTIENEVNDEDLYQKVSQFIEKLWLFWYFGQYFTNNSASLRTKTDIYRKGQGSFLYGFDFGSLVNPMTFIQYLRMIGQLELRNRD